MVYLGTGYAPSGWNTGPASFAFNQKIFPDPEVMFREMHDEGFRVALHVLGTPHHIHGRVADHSPDADSAANYWAEHRAVLNTGIDGWSADDGDELFPEGRCTGRARSVIARTSAPSRCTATAMPALQRYGVLRSVTPTRSGRRCGPRSPTP
jgi:alpha-glucosidase/alpha-D-xyloside xylohydrolase